MTNSIRMGVTGKETIIGHPIYLFDNGGCIEEGTQEVRHGYNTEVRR